MKIYNEDKTRIIWDTKLDSEYLGYTNEEDWILGEYGDYDLYDGKSIEEYKEKYIKLHNYQEPDLEKGYYKNDVLITHYDEVQEVKEEGHWETIKEYPNGGKDVEWVVDVKGVEYQKERNETTQIITYVMFTEEELKENKLNQLRMKRENECFYIINRGSLWYDTLTDEQVEELKKWYRNWLDCTETLEIPEKPEWLK
jgi:hypothetical protein